MRLVAPTMPPFIKTVLLTIAYFLARIALFIGSFGLYGVIAVSIRKVGLMKLIEEATDAAAKEPGLSFLLLPAAIALFILPIYASVKFYKAASIAIDKHLGGKSPSHNQALE